MAKALRRLATVGLVAVTATGCAWGMAGHGPQRSGFSRFETTITAERVAELREVWRSGADTSVTSAPVIGNGKVFASGGPTAASSDASLVAFDAAGTVSCQGGAPRTCAPIWSVGFPPPVLPLREGFDVSPPSFDGGKVYVGLTHLREIAGQYTHTNVYDADTGTPEGGLAHGGRASAAVGSGVLAASVTLVWKPSPGPVVFDTLAVFDTTTLAKRYIAATGADSFVPRFATFSAPALADGVVYATAADRLYAFDANGAVNCEEPQAPPGEQLVCLPLWSAQLAGSTGWDTVPAVANGLVYVPEWDGRVEVFPAAGCGRAVCGVRWSADSGAGHVSPVAVTDSTLFVGSDEGKLSAFPASGCGSSSCPPVWTATPGGGVGPPSVAGSLVFVGTGRGTVAAFDAAGCGRPTCTARWTAGLGAPVRGSPVVAAGRVAVTDTSGVLHVFAPAD